MAMEEDVERIRFRIAMTEREIMEQRQEELGCMTATFLLALFALLVIVCLVFNR